MMNFKAFSYRCLRRPWLGLRGLVESVLPREQLDGWLQHTGFFAFKSKFFRYKKQLPGGILVICRPDDEKVITEIYEHGAYSRPTISETDIIVDVGAHIGLFTLYAAKKSPQGRVIAIEPSLWNLDILRKNIHLNQAANIKVYNCAIADQQGTAKLYHFRDYTMYTLQPGSAESPFEMVPVRTLDSIFKEEGLSTCNLLKIDVEGSEWQVLQGATEALKITRQMILELPKEQNGHKRATAFLESLGFDCSVEADSIGAIVLYACRQPNR